MFGGAAAENIDVSVETILVKLSRCYHRMTEYAGRRPSETGAANVVFELTLGSFRGPLPDPVLDLLARWKVV